MSLGKIDNYFGEEIDVCSLDPKIVKIVGVEMAIAVTKSLNATKNVMEDFEDQILFEKKCDDYYDRKHDELLETSIREEVVLAVLDSEPLGEISNNYKIPEETIIKWKEILWKLWKEEYSIERKYEDNEITEIQMQKMLKPVKKSIEDFLRN